MRHIAILKANQGELKALSHLDQQTATKVGPLFEVGKITESIRDRKWYKDSPTPRTTYLQRVIDGIAKSWKGPCMIDGYQWDADATVEGGEHAIAYMVSRLRSHGLEVIPVIGYDRWEDPAYKLGLKGIPAHKNGRYCIRLDSAALEEISEPERFVETISDIVEEFSANPEDGFLILDFADVSAGSWSIEAMISKATSAIQLLEPLGFGRFSVAGCSLPGTINLAVTDKDADGIILRKEALVWQTLKTDFPHLEIVSGDYGVRGPTTTEIKSKYTNGKIRHTIKNQIFVARGHAFTLDGDFSQMQTLATRVSQSSHFLGQNFCWGDAQIILSRKGLITGNLSHWIAIDTNHHLTFVVQEVVEFELNFGAKTSVDAFS